MSINGFDQFISSLHDIKVATLETGLTVVFVSWVVRETIHHVKPVLKLLRRLPSEKKPPLDHEHDSG